MKAKIVSKILLSLGLVFVLGSTITQSGVITRQARLIQQVPRISKRRYHYP